MNVVDLMLAKAQIRLAYFCAAGIFALVFTLILWPHPDMTSTVVTIITSIISVLATVFTLQMNFFFARTRPPALPDPSMNPSMTTTTTTTSTPTTAPVTVSTASTPLAQPQMEQPK